MNQVIAPVVYYLILETRDRQRGGAMELSLQTKDKMTCLTDNSWDMVMRPKVQIKKNRHIQI